MRLVEVVERCGILLHLVVCGKVEHPPLELALEVPLVELGKLRAHEGELLAGVGKLVAHERAQGGELLVVVAKHLAHHRLLPVDHLVVGVLQDEGLAVGVVHREGQRMVVAGAKQRVGCHIVERIVHKAHVPLEGKAQPPCIRRQGHHRVGRRLLGRHDGAGIALKHGGIELLQEGDGLEVDVAAIFIGDPLGAPVVEVEHRADGIDAQAIDVVGVEQKHRRRDEEADNLRAPVVEDKRAPLLVLALARVGVLVKRLPIEGGKRELVARKVGRHPVEDDPDAVGMEGVHEVHEVLRCAVARGNREVAGRLIAP